MSARTLLYDIEVAPNLGWTWSKRETDVLAFVNEWYILCFSYMFLDEDDEPHVVALPDFRKQYKEDPTNDYKVVEKLHQLLSAADIVVGHNSNSYDNRRVNARLLIHNFDPPKPYKQVDTCLVARRYFSMTSNRLGDLGETLGLGSKEETGGFALWLKVMAGEKSAWDKMRSYNAQDVVLLRDIYLRLRPWIVGHPNVNTGDEDGDLDACPRCGSDNLTKQGMKINKTSRCQQYKCGDCGGWCSSRISEKDAPKPSLVN